MFEGTQLSAEDRELLNHPACRACVESLFSRNFQNPEQIRQLTAEIHALREPHLLIAVDHEGGRVQPFSGGLQLSACGGLGMVRTTARSRNSVSLWQSRGAG